MSMWGDVPSWVTAIATVGLVVAAVTAGIYAALSWRDARAQGLRRAQERRRRVPRRSPLGVARAILPSTTTFGSETATTYRSTIYISW